MVGVVKPALPVVEEGSGSAMENDPRAFPILEGREGMEALERARQILGQEFPGVVIRRTN